MRKGKNGVPSYFASKERVVCLVRLQFLQQEKTSLGNCAALIGGHTGLHLPMVNDGASSPKPSATVRFSYPACCNG